MQFLLLGLIDEIGNRNPLSVVLRRRTEIEYITEGSQSYDSENSSREHQYASFSPRRTDERRSRCLDLSRLLNLDGGFNGDARSNRHCTDGSARDFRRFLSQPAEIDDHVGDRLISIVGILFECAINDVDEFRRDIGEVLLDWLRIFVEDRVHHCRLVLPAEWKTTGEQLEKK